jgi:ubiquinone/menaquinone biosynthesis C-methylase UbiE
MDEEIEVASHYVHGSLIQAIEEGLNRQGKTISTISIDDVSSIDEFHIGGRQASEDFVTQMELEEQSLVLDVGCGLGGPARFVAASFGCSVTGIDLTHEYVDTGNIISNWVGLDKKVILQQGSAMALPFPDGQFDAAYMMHVGMNISDKKSLFSQIFKILKPGGKFGVYDVMQLQEGGIDYPVPWAASAKTSSLASPERYQRLLEQSGFTISGMRERSGFAVEFFEAMQKKLASSQGMPELGLHVLMGADTKQKMANVMQGIRSGVIAPVELLVEK